MTWVVFLIDTSVIAHFNCMLTGLINFNSKFSNETKSLLTKKIIFLYIN